MMKLILAFCSFANAPKKVPLKDCELLTVRHAPGQKTKGPQVQQTVSPHGHAGAKTHAYGGGKLIKLCVSFQYGMNVDGM